MGRFSVEYIDELLAGAEYGQLVEISAIICGSAGFSRNSPDYGLPTVGFVFAEALTWFAQAIRSSVWTYYEATPLARQQAMLSALRELAPAPFAAWYKRSMDDWTDLTKIRALDNWLEAKAKEANDWLRNLLVENREIVLQLTT
jgi:hypothetical protein